MSELGREHGQEDGLAVNGTLVSLATVFLLLREQLAHPR